MLCFVGIPRWSFFWRFWIVVVFVVSGTRYWRTGRSGSSLSKKYFAVSFGSSCMLIICFVGE